MAQGANRRQLNRLWFPRLYQLPKHSLPGRSASESQQIDGIDAYIRRLGRIGLAPWRYAPGPIFYRQLRSRLQNIPFAIYKYRTMYVANPDPSRQATEGDSRIYPAGRWLRKLSIDELPQLFNVIRGEMSLVGPRPCLPTQTELIERRNQLGVSPMLPGITGLAQIRGIDMSNPELLAETDAAYLRTASFWLDLRILFGTLYRN
jgi:O-antigen biosynthesis protein WbqP